MPLGQTIGALLNKRLLFKIKQHKNAICNLFPAQATETTSCLNLHILEVMSFRFRNELNRTNNTLYLLLLFKLIHLVWLSIRYHYYVYQFHQFISSCS